MTKKRRSLTENVSKRVAHVHRAAERNRFLRLFGGRGAVTVFLGCALSIGGMTEALSGVHFLVEKDLDAVRVVRAHTLPQANASTRVLGKCGFTFTGPVEDPEDGLVWRWERPRQLGDLP